MRIMNLKFVVYFSRYAHSYRRDAIYLREIRINARVIGSRNLLELCMMPREAHTAT